MEGVASSSDVFVLALDFCVYICITVYMHGKSVCVRRRGFDSIAQGRRQFALDLSLAASICCLIGTIFFLCTERDGTQIIYHPNAIATMLYLHQVEII